jgi:hypothetical protein
MKNTLRTILILLNFVRFSLWSRIVSNLIYVLWELENSVYSVVVIGLRQNVLWISAGSCQLMMFFYILVDLPSRHPTSCWERVLKYPTTIMDLSSSLFQFYQPLLHLFYSSVVRACVFIIAISSWWIGIFIIM